MLLSPTTTFIHNGLIVEMQVVRNDGYCWGRMTLPTGHQVEVTVSRDQYERSDEEAIKTFIKAAKRQHLRKTRK